MHRRPPSTRPPASHGPSPSARRTVEAGRTQTCTGPSSAGSRAAPRLDVRHAPWIQAADVVLVDRIDARTAGGTLWMRSLTIAPGRVSPTALEHQVAVPSAPGQPAAERPCHDRGGGQRAGEQRPANQSRGRAGRARDDETDQTPAPHADAPSPAAACLPLGLRGLLTLMAGTPTSVMIRLQRHPSMLHFTSRWPSSPLSPAGET